jgi:hypothetical protein
MGIRPIWRLAPSTDVPVIWFLSMAYVMVAFEYRYTHVHLPGCPPPLFLLTGVVQYTAAKRAMA